MSIDPAPIWYGRHPLVWPLLPLSWLYCAVVRLRRLGYRQGWLASERVPVPVIVVGNLTVGGTGKTPLVLYLARLLREHGWTPGIVTRGYGGRAPHWPQPVRADSAPDLVGDEPLLLARRSACPVIAGPDRVAAARLALQRHACDILVSDDGLQHYRLQRDLEIVLVDGTRGLGNAHCLPAGPLREPRARLTSVDLVLYKEGAGWGPSMSLAPGEAVSLQAPERRRALSDFLGRPVCAVAGIGDPERFFALLEDAGLEVERMPFADHHRFTEADLRPLRERTVIMTEKDAVKCSSFAGPDHWYLPVDAIVDQAFERRLLSFIARFAHG